jgi:transcriptional regulator
MARSDGELVRGTFDMMLLKALSLGPTHGWGLSERIERLSGTFEVQQGVVYPALQRLLRQGLVTAEWRTTENNRRARIYRITASGKRHLADETDTWQRAVAGVARLLRAQPEVG